MKRILILLLAVVICISLCSCTPLSNVRSISFNEDYSETYYNGRTYIENNNRKYRIDFEGDAEHWVELATLPYGYFYILGAVTVFYGNDAEDPAFIADSRVKSLAVREDVALDHSCMLSVLDTEETFCFRIADAITENVIPYNVDEDLQCNSICNFFARFEDYPGIQLWIEICEYNGKFYLQDCWNSDYYEITDAFMESLYEYGVNAFDYH